MGSVTEYHKAWRARNRELVNSYHKRYRQDHLEQRMLTYAKCRAKKFGVPFALKMGDLTLPNQCPILGIPLVYESRDGRKNRDDAPSVDRVRPQMGYVAGNVQVISLRANRIKNDATPDELRKVADYMDMFYG